MIAGRENQTKITRQILKDGPLNVVAQSQTKKAKDTNEQLDQTRKSFGETKLSKRQIYLGQRR